MKPLELTFDITIVPYGPVYFPVLLADVDGVDVAEAVTVGDGDGVGLIETVGFGVGDFVLFPATTFELPELSN